VKNLDADAENVRSRVESTGGCVKFKLVTMKRLVHLYLYLVHHPYHTHYNRKIVHPVVSQAFNNQSPQRQNILLKESNQGRKMTKQINKRKNTH